VRSITGPGAVVIGGYINGLGLVRSLSGRGVPAAVVTTLPCDIAHYSRHICGHEAVEDIAGHPERLIELLQRKAKDWRGWTLFPASDEAVEILANHRETLSATYRVLAPPAEVAARIMDKRVGSEAARRAGVGVARCYGYSDEGIESMNGLAYPVLVKPVVSHAFRRRFERKLFLARDHDDLARRIAEVREAKLACEILEVIPGPDSQVYEYAVYVDSKGEPGPGLTVHKLRQSPPLFGVARVAEVVPEIPAMREAAVEILRRLEYRGIAGVEFKVDPRDGSLRFLEVNGRAVIFNKLLQRAGLDLTSMAYFDTGNGSIEQPVPNGWPGVWVNTHADFLYMAFRRDKPRLSWRDFAATYKRPVIEAAWSVDDPRPYLTLWARTARSGVSGVLRGGLKLPQAAPELPSETTTRTLPPSGL
jgi:predicted ATP-grasp superfamily ATP-dependent carboligase